MKDKFRYIPKKDRKKILLLSDDLRMHSGVATMSREIVMNTAHHFNWYQLGAALEHPEKGKIFDLNDDLNKRLNMTDADVKVEPCTGYGDPDKIRALLGQEKPDAIFIFTDPRYWIWLFEMEREIRSKIPIVWLNIWDQYPAPLYNEVYYNSVDCLMAISKQTKNINEIVLGEKANNKTIEYVPHGIDDQAFFPIKEDHPSIENYKTFRKDLFNGKDIDYVVFFNSRNIQRKHPADTILAFKLFCDKIGKEKAAKCALVMKTEISSPHGTDLRAVKDALCDEDMNIFFNQERLTPEQMNLLYNVADTTVLMSSNEGWGLALTESMMSGTMFIGNVTGGMQDQMRFEDEDGKWMELSPDLPSNNRKTISKHGEWCLPVWPTNSAMMGSPLTPYIFDDRCSAEDAADRLVEAYNLGPEERSRRGQIGRDWAMSEEAMMTARTMGNRVITVLDDAFEKFEPRPSFDLIKVENIEKRKVTHKLTGY